MRPPTNEFPAGLVGVALAVAVAACGSSAPDAQSASAEPPGPAPAAAPPVHAELISDTAIVQPGAMLKLGVHLSIAPGWHMHWTNPGEAGQPLAVDLRLPGRFSAGPLQWPAPVRFTRPDGAEGFGYRDEVVLLADVRSSNRDVDDGETWPLRAEVSWVACARECLPGHAELALQLPGSISGTRLVDLISAPRVEEWAGRMPIDARSAHAPFVASAARSGGRQYVLSLSWDSPPAEVEWFPSAGTAAAGGPGVVVREGRTTRIVLTPPTPRAQPLDDVTGVVVYTTTTGERLAANLAVALNRPAEP